MIELYFMRHGESTSNANHIITGRADVPLTDKGMAQAREAGLDIHRNKLTFDVIISSPLQRALTTARIVADENGYPATEIVINDLFTEQSRGTLEGKSLDLLKNITDAELVAYGGEGSEALAARAAEALEWIKQNTSGTVLVVSHNRIGMEILAQASGSPLQIGKISNAQLIHVTLK